MKVFFFLLSCLLTAHTLSAYEQAFPKTEVATIEIKTIPASRLIVSESKGHYFAENNQLFRPLFRYISQNDIQMTTPVESEMMPGKMYFYLGADATDRELTPTESVRLIEMPERKVASIGARGSYTEGNFNEALKQLEAWLKKQPTLQPSGAPRAVFWNGPFTPGFLKRFEVHIPVVEKVVQPSAE